MNIVVPSTLRPGKKIAIVGEAPGKTEVAACEGFVGSAGKVLDKLLGLGGLTREDVSLLNVVKRPPDGGYDSSHFRSTFYKVYDKKTKDEPTDELLAWYDLLRDELMQLKPNVVIAFGNEALKALCGLWGITDWQGSIVESTLVPGLKVVPMIHPAAILRSAAWQQFYINGRLLRDKVIVESKAAAIKRIPWEQILMPNMDEIHAWFMDLRRWHTRWSLDIETRGGHLACVGMATRIGNGDRAICVPIQMMDGSYMSPENELAFWLDLQKTMNENDLLVGHNIGFDLDWLLDYGVMPRKIYMDTMTAFHHVHPELPKGLWFVNMMYTDIPFYKKEGWISNSRTPDMDLHKYNIKDVVSTLRCSFAVESEMSPLVKQIYFDRVNDLLYLTLEMQQRGLVINNDNIALVRKVVDDSLVNVHEKLRLLIDQDINVSSSKQVQDLLYNKMKLPVKLNRKTHLPTADEGALIELLSKHDSDVLRYIIIERHTRKAKESYLHDKMDVDNE